MTASHYKAYTVASLIPDSPQTSAIRNASRKQSLRYRDHFTRCRIFFAAGDCCSEHLPRKRYTTVYEQAFAMLATRAVCLLSLVAVVALLQSAAAQTAGSSASGASTVSSGELLNRICVVVWSTFFLILFVSDCFLVRSNEQSDTAICGWSIAVSVGTCQSGFRSQLRQQRSPFPARIYLRL